jgi:hypothetical protein
MVYTIVVHLLAKPDPESISKLKAKLVEASQVYSKDKETLSWFVMQDVSDKRKFTIVERYLNESVCTQYFCFLGFLLWKTGVDGARLKAARCIIGWIAIIFAPFLSIGVTLADDD